MNRLDSNMRLTSQRQIILEELKKVKSHPTADEMYDMVRKRLPRIGGLAPFTETWISWLSWE